MLRHSFAARRTWRKAALATAMLLSIPSMANAQEPALQTWSDGSGNKLEASFVRLEGDTVVLAKKDNSQVKVPLEKLGLMSQLQAKKAADPAAFAKPEPPPPPPAMEMESFGESPFPENATPEQTFQIILDQLKNKKPGALWHAMTPQMQKDLEEIVTASADIAGPKVLKQIPIVFQNLLTIVRDKQLLVANMSINNQPAAAPQESRRVLAMLVPLLDKLAKQSTWSPENFKDGKTQGWIMTMLQDMVTTQLQLANMPRQGVQQTPVDFGKIKFKLATKDDTTAEFDVTAPGRPPAKAAFTKVGNRWLPSEMVANWDSEMSQVKSQLASFDEEKKKQTRTQITTALAFINGILGSLASARTQEEFNLVAGQLAPFIPRMNNNSFGSDAMGAPGDFGSGMSGGSSGSSGGSMPFPGRSAEAGSGGSR